MWSGLLERSVLIRNCASWDGLGGCLRVTIGRPDENDRLALMPCEVRRALHEFVEQPQHRDDRSRVDVGAGGFVVERDIAADNR